MESNLLRAIKFRVFDELQNSVNAHVQYRNKVKVWHKYPYKAREHMGVYMRNVSATRIKLSADDYAGALKSHLAMARAENHEGKFLEWVWEDSNNITKWEEEDVSSQVDGSTRLFTLSKEMIAGQGNTSIANNIGQVTVTINGTKIFPEFVDGKRKIVMVPECPAATDVVKIGYYYNNLTPAGRYYIRIATPTLFDISPLYQVTGEVVIQQTTGTETSVTLDKSNLLPGNEILYTKKGKNSHKIYLDRSTDYTIDNTTGEITFLEPLKANTTLYANYRWIGDLLGPFDIPDERYHYVNDALPGVTLAFGNEIIVGDQLVVIVYKSREVAAKVYSGHWGMNFDIEVFGRDPIQLPELTDQIVDHMWSKREKLVGEGLTLEELEPTGEVEEVYIEGTNDQYYKNTITMTMMTEWKRINAYKYQLLDYNTQVSTSLQTFDYVVNNQGVMMQLHLEPVYKSVEVIYPKVGYPRYL